MPELAPVDWSIVTPGARAWLDANQAELDIWKQATVHPEFQSHSLRTIRPLEPLFVESSFHTFARLALLDAAKREAAADMSGALDNYRALYRSSRHVGQGNGTMARLTGARLHRAACEALARWATDPRATAQLLRRALENVCSDERLTATRSDAIRADYLSILALLDDHDSDARRARHDLRYWREGPPLSRPGVGRTQGYELLPLPERSAEWVKRLSTEVGWSAAQEPQRSRRILRLIIANRLAHADDPPDRPATVAVRDPLLYVTTSTDSDAARALAPGVLKDWYVSSNLSKIVPETFSGTLEAALERERAEQRHLVQVLSTELAQRQDADAQHGR
jgi:hypothetical protein